MSLASRWAVQTRTSVLCTVAGCRVTVALRPTVSTSRAGAPRPAASPALATLALRIGSSTHKVTLIIIDHFSVITEPSRLSGHQRVYNRQPQLCEKRHRRHLQQHSRWGGLCCNFLGDFVSRRASNPSTGSKVRAILLKG